ncbi:MAG: hybrid sensor histidine kinase/response regulator [Bacteroidales bacterium]|nr:hybrid sensor histidine kinase/response regulator [Bacteroidales bacterium]
MNKKFNLLYVDDEVSNLNVFKNAFRRKYNIFTAENALEGMEILERENIDLVITDQRMPEVSGVEFLKKVMTRYPQPNRILITAYTDFDALKDAVNHARIFQFIQKPWHENDIQEIIDNALDIYQLKKKNIELTEKLKDNNTELIRLNNELLELDKLKFQFLHIINHEIRTPLNGLTGVTYLFKSELEKEDNNKYQMLFHMLESATNRLEHFLLLAERITMFKAKNFKVNQDIIQINKLTHEVVEVLKGKIFEKNINIEFELSDEEAVNCLADRQLIEICLIEVIDNAIKYSERNGKIIIRTILNDNSLIIDIIDEGPGFPDIVLKNIFKPFITSNSYTEQGMGLDLALIKLIIEAHDGIININNNETRGSTVQMIFGR